MKKVWGPKPWTKSFNGFRMVEKLVLELSFKKIDFWKNTVTQNYKFRCEIKFATLYIFWPLSHRHFEVICFQVFSLFLQSKNASWRKHLFIFFFFKLGIRLLIAGIQPLKVYFFFKFSFRSVTAGYSVTVKLLKFYAKWVFLSDI